MDTNGNYLQTQFCSYEIALKLEELGFDEPCFAVYSVREFKYNFELLEQGWLKEELLSNELTNTMYANWSDFVTAPLWQQAIVFLLKQLEDIDFLASVRVFSDQSGNIVLYNGKKEISFDTLEECVNSIIEILTEQNQDK